jgi:hypothetical protein
MHRTVLIGIIFVAAVLAFLIYSSMHIANSRVEVCVEFGGRTSCRVSSADTKEHALRTAQSNACALIASGVTDTMQCEHSNPVSVKWLEKR